MTARPRVSVVVPTRNRARLLPPLVEAILTEQVTDVELLVVDDASTDATAPTLQDLAARHPELQALSLTEHAGPAAARNLGWRAARADVVAFTDDDCVPQPGWLTKLLQAHDTGADVVQGRTLPDRPHYEGNTFSRVVSVTEFSDLYQTCNVSYRRHWLERLNGFDESFGTSRGGAPNGEDADLGWRAAEDGARCVFAPEALVLHPVVDASFRDALRGRLRSFRMAYFLSRHPGYRRRLQWRVFFQPSHPWALLALSGFVPLAVLRRWPMAIVTVAGALPYVVFRVRVRPLPGRRRLQPLIIVAAWIVDLADVAVLAGGSVRWRCLLL